MPVIACSVARYARLLTGYFYLRAVLGVHPLTSDKRLAFNEALVLDSRELTQPSR